MTVKIPTPAQDVNVSVEAPMPEPTILVTREEVEARTAGLTVARVQVENTDGTVATFFVTVAVKNGRACAELTAKLNGGEATTLYAAGHPKKSETKRTAFADWRL